MKPRDPASDPRYVRQVGLPEIGPAGQRKLAESRVLVIGAGGLGSPLLFGLAGAGVGHLTIVDHDLVSESNLNRQFLYQADEVGSLKAELAARRLKAYHPDLSVEAVPGLLSEQNADALIGSHDLVIAAVDSRQSRLLINQFCCKLGKTMVDGGVRGLDGYLAVIEPGRTPCYCCLFGAGPVHQAEVSPVLGTVAGTIGSMEATLAILLLLGQDNPLAGEVLYVDSKSMSFDRLKIKRDPACPHCAALYENTEC